MPYLVFLVAMVVLARFIFEATDDTRKAVIGGGDEMDATDWDFGEEKEN